MCHELTRSILSPQSLFEVSLQLYGWNYFSPQAPGVPYPRLETQGSQQASMSTVVADTCSDPAAPTLPYTKGDIHNHKFDFSLVSWQMADGRWLSPGVELLVLQAI